MFRRKKYHPNRELGRSVSRMCVTRDHCDAPQSSARPVKVSRKQAHKRE